MQASSSINESRGLSKTLLVVCDSFSACHHSAVEALRETVAPHGYGTLCITGREIKAGADDDGCTGAYRLAASMDVAGAVIMASTLGHSVTEEVVERFVGHFTDAPLVTLGQRTVHGRAWAYRR